MTNKSKREIRKMFKWAIEKMFEQNEGDVANIHELRRELEGAWEELDEEDFFDS